MPNASKPDTSLWTIFEALQRRLERLGLSSDHVDAVVTHTVAGALSGSPRRSGRS